MDNDLLRRGGPDGCTAPSEVGWPPGGSAGVPDIVPQEKGCEPKLRGLEIADGIFTRPAQVPHGFIVTRGDGDGGAVARAHQACQFAGITTIGFDTIPGLLGLKEGATTQQTWPFVVRERESQSPQEPAAETKRRGVLLACIFRRS